MKYLVIIYGNEALWNSLPDTEREELIAATDAHNTSLLATGEMLGAYGLAEQSRAKQVTRVQDETIVTDGPYIEAKEYIGSFYLIDVETEARAIQIAAEMPSATFRQIELRPIMHEAPENCDTP